MPSLVNNENEVPQHANRPAKAFNVLNDIGKAEKRPRGLKPQTATTTTRRAVLGDVTNKLGGVKRTAAMAMQKKPLAKRTTQTTITSKLVETTPVSNTFGTMGIKEGTTPVVRSAEKLQEIVDLASDEEEENHDIDSDDKNNASACWQYAEDITKYQLEDEKKRKPSASYMSRQSDINSKMRAILVDWLVDVHCKYDLLPQTLHIAIHLIDQYLEKDMSVPRQKLQLVGVTALFIASKYEEIYPPEADDFVRITDNAYTRDELFRMEEDLLASIQYRVTFPTKYQFVKRFLKASRTSDDRVEHFAHYVIDRSLQEYKLIKYLPSTVAASAVHIARTQMRDLPAWSSTLEYHSSYAEHALTDCVEDLKEMLWNAQNGVGKTSKLTAVRRKFSKERFMGVSSHPLVFDESS
uniref:Cyclin N-terminal domain-containing protein n=1 Tax=Globisporangium ultimum (strain ATCC 200006 / CBS 805.95 / DAOM BR144) TaxID=431595 RepID=K3WKR6_GLOUD